MAKLATHPNLEKFNGNKIELDAFLTQLNLQLLRNIDHFTREEQNTEQSKLSYAISRLERDEFAQIKPYVSAKNIDFENINQFMEVFKTCFGKVKLVDTAKHKLYRLYKTHKNLEIFLKTLLQLSKKAKIDDSQVLDMLYKILNNEFKDWLVTIRNKKNLNNLILLLPNIDANMKKISKQSQLHVKSNASNFPTIKPPFKSYNLTPTKPCIVVRVAVVSSVPSTTTRTHPGPMDVFNEIKRGPILQEEKDRHNSLHLCYYYNKPGHIAINHRNSGLLTTKRQIVDALTGNLMVLVPYKSLSVEEKKMSLG